MVIPYKKADSNRKTVIMNAYKEIHMTLHLLIGALYHTKNNLSVAQNCRNIFYNVYQNYIIFLEFCLNACLKYQNSELDSSYVKISDYLETLHKNKIVKSNFSKNKIDTYLRRKNEFAISLLKNICQTNKNDANNMIVKTIKELVSSTKVNRKPKEVLRFINELNQTFEKLTSNFYFYLNLIL